MKKRLNLVKVFIAILLFVTSCKKEIVEDPYINLQQGTANFHKDGGSVNLTVDTNIVNWVVTVPDEAKSWVTATKRSSYVIIQAKENDNKEPRSARIVISGSGVKKEVRVDQLGTGYSIVISEKMITQEATGGTFDIVVTSNVEYDIIIQDEDAKWLSVASTKQNVSDTTSKKITFEVKLNAKDEDREAKITFKQKDGDLEEEVAVVQKKQGYYTLGEISEKEDVKLGVTSGQASSYQSGSGIEKSYDGDYGTTYHSNWNNGGSNYFPITLEYFFTNEELLNYIIYYPRISGSNGIFKKVEIWTKSDGDIDYVKQMEYSFQQNNSPTKIVFPNPIVNPQSVKFVVLEGYGDGQGFASCAEMEFYKYNPDNFDPTSIFTDNLCTDLKPSITDQDIMNIPDLFYKNMAYHMKKGTYPREFRIQEYRAWENPNTRASNNRNRPYSEIEGVTGIYVDEGEKLLVFVGDTHGRTISLKFVDLDKPGGDGYYTNKSAPLSEGKNVVITPSKGLVYVIYNYDDYQNLSPIKIHFATGKVNGYFDTTKHTEADWDRIINAAPYKYFDVMGEKAHLLFETADYKSHCRTAQGMMNVINQFDKLVYDEQVLMGMYKYNRVPANRALFHVMYQGYMYSTSYRTAYNHNTVQAFLTPDGLKTNPWGPAHELGHTHQVVPLVKWAGMTECTVNIPSLYIQTGWGNESRIQRENRYNNGYKKLMVQKVSHFQAGIWENLPPFWQLKLYIEDVKGVTDFYKDVYEVARTREVPGGSGRHMLEFSFIASEKAGLDLTDFFEAWGYYRPISMTVDDYGKYQVNVTESDINSVKSRIGSLNLPKPSYAMRYICDNNVDIFKNQRSIVTGSHSVSGSKIIMTGWKNVVAYEVWEGDELVYATNDSEFVLNEDPSSTIKVYAIAYDGTKVQVN